MTTFADLVDKFKVPPPVGAARIVQGSAMKDDDAPAENIPSRQQGNAGGLSSDGVSLAGGRDPKTPAPTQEPPMPRGIYDRKKKEGAAPPEKKKRVQHRKAKPLADDLGALSLEALVASGTHLAATIREEVDGLDDCPALLQAVRGHELALKIHAAAGNGKA